MTLADMLADPPLRHFTAAEFLTLGAGHSSGAGKGLNTPPPAILFPKIARVARVADELREAFGGPLRVLSCYRSHAYNRAIGGAAMSYHCRGLAVDLSPVSAPVSALHRVARALHAPGKPLDGGLGFYPWGVHVDLGPFRDW